ncbi:MAG: hypothetical protein WC291_06905 [Thermodesulfovibrionales bacterium]|jgi:small-conductance mechanosensitive channel
MARFEEVQMRIAESAKRHLDIYNMEVFIEQFTLDRESKLYLTLNGMEPPLAISAVVSFTYDAFQTGMTLLENEPEEDESVDTSIELGFTISLPLLEDYPDIEDLVEEISEEFPDAEPVLISREIYPREEESKEYEISYSYDIDPEDVMDTDLFDEIFEELKGIMDLLYKRTKDFNNWQDQDREE